MIPKLYQSSLVFRFLCFLVFFMAVFYFLFSFSYSDLNFSHWDAWGRFFCALLSFGFAIGFADKKGVL